LRLLLNTMHLPPVALVVLIGAAMTGMSPFVYVGDLAWLGHIAVGWGTGDRVRSAEAVVGKKPTVLHAGSAAVAPTAAGSSAL
jgi:hypothetical protein